MTGLSTAFVLAICLVNVNSQSCCSRKMVGPIEYQLVGGSTDGYPMCKPGCVYEDISNPGEPFCFEAGGDLEVKCLDSSDATAPSPLSPSPSSSSPLSPSPPSHTPSPPSDTPSPPSDTPSPPSDTPSSPS